MHLTLLDTNCFGLDWATWAEPLLAAAVPVALVLAAACAVVHVRSHLVRSR